MTKSNKNLVNAMVKACEDKGLNPFIKIDSWYLITRIIHNLLILDECEMEVIDDYVYSLECDYCN